MGCAEDVKIRERHNKPPPWVPFFERRFLVAFAVEIIIRIGLSPTEFFTKDGSKWNLFDLGLAISGVLQLFEDGTNLSYFRPLRMFRLIRVLHVVKLFRELRHLRIMTMMIGGAVSAVLWALIFMLLLCYMFAIFFMGMLTDQLKANANAELQGPEACGTLGWYCSWVHGSFDAGKYVTVEEWELDVYAKYGSFKVTMENLLASVSGGTEWVGIAEPLRYTGRAGLAFYVFMLFTFFMVFGLLNILTGLILESTAEAVRGDKETVLEAARQDEWSFMTKLRDLLLNADEDNSVFALVRIL